MIFEEVCCVDEVVFKVFFDVIVYVYVLLG